MPGSQDGEQKTWRPGYHELLRTLSEHGHVEEVHLRMEQGGGGIGAGRFAAGATRLLLFIRASGDEAA